MYFKVTVKEQLADGKFVFEVVADAQVFERAKEALEDESTLSHCFDVILDEMNDMTEEGDSMVGQCFIEFGQ